MRVEGSWIFERESFMNRTVSISLGALILLIIVVALIF
jgi:hypothetical protein